MKKILIIFLFYGVAAAQTRTNLEIFYTLLDSALTEAVNNSSADSDSLFYFESGDANNIFYNHAAAGLLDRNYKDAPMQDADLVFLVDQTSVIYGEMFRDGLFGSFYIPRELQLQGNYLNKENKVHRTFNLVYSDTVAMESVEFIENQMYPLTKGKIPPEPFFSSLLEPAIAIGTAALVVILFFSIRSK